MHKYRHEKQIFQANLSYMSSKLHKYIDLNNLGSEQSFKEIMRLISKPKFNSQYSKKNFMTLLMILTYLNDQLCIDEYKKVMEATARLPGLDVKIKKFEEDCAFIPSILSELKQFINKNPEKAMQVDQCKDAKAPEGSNDQH